MNNVVYFDIEVYMNYVLVCFKKDGEFINFERFGSEKTFETDIKTMKNIVSNNIIVGYNIENYDNEILYKLLSGSSVSDLYELSQDIIDRKIKHRRSEGKYNHLDLVFYFNNSRYRGLISLKKLAMIEKHEILETLPFDPTKPLQENQLDKMRFYCQNDVNITEKLYLLKEDTIKSRKKMGERIGLDISNLTESEIADKYIAIQLKRKDPRFRIERKEYTCFDDFTFDESNDFEKQVESDSTEDMLDLLHKMKKIRFKFEQRKSRLYEHIPPKFSEKITIGGVTYSVGLGGLHGVLDKWYDIKEKAIALDVASYYPTLIVKYNCYPKNLNKSFIEVYDKIIKDRLEAKKTDPEMAAFLKISINSVYGKFGESGSYNNYLYFPEGMYKVTMMGQYLLLVLINKLTEKGLKVIEANTDGILIEDGDYKDIIDEWQRKYLLKLEEKVVEKGFIKDVSNRVYYYEGGETIGKGEFDYKKQPKFFIVQKAIENFKIHGTPIDEFIRNHKEVNDFLFVAEQRDSTSKNNLVKKPSTVLYSFIEDENGVEIEHIPKLVRYYKSRTSKNTIKAKRQSGDTITYKKYDHGDNVGIANEITDQEAILNDLDHDFYIEQTMITLNGKQKKAKKNPKEAVVKERKPRKTKASTIDDAIKHFKTLYIGQKSSKYRLPAAKERYDYSREELIDLVTKKKHSLKRKVEENECLIDVDNVGSFNAFLAESKLLELLRVSELKANTRTKRGAHYRLVFENEVSMNNFISIYKGKYEGVEFKKPGSDETIAPSIIEKDGEVTKYTYDTFEPYVIPSGIYDTPASNTEETVREYEESDVDDNKNYNYDIILEHYPTESNEGTYALWRDLCFAFSVEIRRGRISKDEAVDRISSWASQNHNYNNERSRQETENKVTACMSREVKRELTMATIDKIAKEQIDLKIAKLHYQRSNSSFPFDQDKLTEVFDRYAIYSDSTKNQKRFCDLETGLDLGELEFDKINAGFRRELKDKRFKELSPSNLFLSSHLGYSYKLINGRGYNPVLSDCRTYTEGDRVFVNDYYFNSRPDLATQEEYDMYGEEVSTVLEEHFKLIANFNDRDATYLRDYYAWIVQNPGKRHNYSPMIISHVEGVGKSFLADMMRKVLGEKNSMSVTGERFFSSMKFNYGISKSLMLFIEEVSSVISGGKKDTMNLLKDMITGKTLMVEKKYHEATQIKNYINYTFLTNEPALMRAGRHSRRILFYIMNIPNNPSDLDNFYKEKFGMSRKDYGARLYSIINDAAKVRVLKSYLMNHVKPVYHYEAPNTESKDHYINEHDMFVLGFDKRELEELIRSDKYNGVTPDCFSHKELIKAMDDTDMDFKDVHKTKSSSFMSKIYSELGFRHYRPSAEGRRYRLLIKSHLFSDKIKLEKAVAAYIESLKRRNEDED